MTSRPPAQVGPYEITAELGAGGMGRVYKARDTRLNRTVAIKVAHERFTERTTREARALATLNHPHICQIYDIGEFPDGAGYIVMEYLEGETLAERLARGPIPVDQAVRIASQIADALQAAHRQGIIHRDLKPGNIIFSKASVKLLDFGLVRLTNPAGAGETTVTSVTAPGAILGTLPYMAPEQLKGKEADARSDLFAFGAVLYEMVTGRRAFEAESQAALISAILSGEPPAIRDVQPAVPAPVVRIVQNCLVKDPDGRWQSAHDVHLALAALETSAAPSAGRSFRRERLAWALALLLVTVMAVFGLVNLRDRPQAAQSVRASLPPPANWYFERWSFAISPDGSSLAFVAIGPDGERRLWLRALAAATAQQFNGSDGAESPFWSPDSRRIGFFAGGKLKTVEVGAGTVRTVCDAAVGRWGGAWSPKGAIVFSPNLVGPLYRVPDTGGTPVPVTTVARASSSQAHRWPVFLPGGERFLYSAGWSGSDDPQGDGLYAGSLAGGKAELVDAEVQGNVACFAGRLIYARDRSLRAQTFDESRLKLSGAAVSIVEQEVEWSPGSYSAFSVAGNGVLVFQSQTDSASRLTWLDPSGKELSRIPESGYSQPRISPDGRLVAVMADDSGNGKQFVHVYDLGRGSSTRISNRGHEATPAWSRDGRRIIYGTVEGQVWQVHEAPADLSGPPQVLLQGPPMRHFDWSPEGRLLFSHFGAGAPRLKVYSATRDEAADFGTEFAALGRFSPDGRWIVYLGLGHVVFAEPFPGPGGRVQISTGVGMQPVWSRNGRQIFYITDDRKLMSVDFDSRTGSAGVPRLVAQTRIVATRYSTTQYDVAPDGRILINSIPPDHSSPLTLLTGWLKE